MSEIADARTPLEATGLCHGSLCSQGDHYDIPALDSTHMPMLCHLVLQYSCPENPHGQRSLAGYRSQGHKELDTTEHLSRTQHTVHLQSECEHGSLVKVHAHPHDAQTKSSSTQVANTDVLTNRNGRRVKVGKQEGNHRRTGHERCPRAALERGSSLQRRERISNAKVVGTFATCWGDFGCD